MRDLVARLGSAFCASHAPGDTFVLLSAARYCLDWRVSPLSLLTYALFLLLLSGCGGASKNTSSDGAQRDGGGTFADAAGQTRDGASAANDGGVPGAADAAVDPARAGDYVVGTARIEVLAAGDRTLPVQLWYPAVESARAEAEQGRPTEDFEPAGEKHDQLAKLVAEAPEICTRKTMNAADAPDALPRAKAWPLLVFSHCMDCIRFSAFSIAEHLASLGFVVAAPDHVDGTLYENTGTLNAEFLKTRAADIQSVIDVLLDAGARAVPKSLRGRLDADRIGVFGHSYGSVTTGLVLQNDPRVKAGVMIAAPPESPLLAGVSIKQIGVPGMFIEATEDGSISAAGNLLIESNYNAYPEPAWLIKVEDAGHWSFSDIAGLGGTFKPGCGMGTRANLAPFTYLDIELAREIAESYIAAFFAQELLGDAVAGAYLKKATPADVVTLSRHD